MTRLRRAWAVLLGRQDWLVELLKDRGAERLSLRASLDDARAEVTRLSAQAKRRDELVREAHALLGTAITDDRGPTL